MGVIFIKKLAWLLALLWIGGCIFKAGTIQPDAPASTSLRAVYLVQDRTELSSEELEAHPDVVVVHRFNDFKKYTNQKIALWIDKSATPLDSDQAKCMNEAPQAYYPIVLVGTSDTLHAFRDLLGLCCFMGPAGDYPGYDAPGFSIIQRKETDEPEAPEVIFLQGYNQKPTIPAILENTNALLEGRWKPTPIELAPPVATATP